MIDKTISHYEILEELGDDGMGVVKEKELGQMSKRDDRIALQIY